MPSGSLLTRYYLLTHQTYLPSPSQDFPGTSAFQALTPAWPKQLVRCRGGGSQSWIFPRSRLILELGGIVNKKPLKQRTLSTADKDEMTKTAGAVDWMGSKELCLLKQKSPKKVFAQLSKALCHTLNMPNTKQTKIKAAVEESILWHPAPCIQLQGHFGFEHINHHSIRQIKQHQTSRKKRSHRARLRAFILPTPTRTRVNLYFAATQDSHSSWSEKGEKHQASKFTKNPVCFKLWFRYWENWDPAGCLNEPNMVFAQKANWHKKHIRLQL